MFEFDFHGFHQALAGLHPVPGVYVHVLAIKALGAVVGVAGTDDPMPAIAANKIFNLSLEEFHYSGAPQGVQSEVAIVNPKLIFRVVVTYQG